MESLYGGDRKDLDAWKWWTTTLKVQWWGGDKGEEWFWERWKTVVETFDKEAREAAMAAGMARSSQA